MANTVQRLHALSPDMPNFVLGKSLGNFYQYVTRVVQLKIFGPFFRGHMFGEPLLVSEHNIPWFHGYHGYLVPSYKLVLKRHKLERRFVSHCDKRKTFTEQFTNSL
ncbi:uncharacterized protein V6R79_026172 [Siganus canaliculatus]